MSYAAKRAKGLGTSKKHQRKYLKKEELAHTKRRKTAAKTGFSKGTSWSKHKKVM